MEITVGYGKVNLASGSATYSAMVVAKDFKRVSAALAGRQRAKPVWTPVGVISEFGAVASSPVEHEEGTLILLQASQKRRGVPIRDGAIFLRLRTGAALLSIDAKMPLGPQNLLGERFTMFTGNADIVAPSELLALGVSVGKSYIRGYCDPDEIGECFVVRKISPERTARPTLQLISRPDGGTETVAVAAAPMRRMRFGRR